MVPLPSAPRSCPPLLATAVAVAVLDNEPGDSMATVFWVCVWRGHRPYASSPALILRGYIFVCHLGALDASSSGSDAQKQRSEQKVMKNHAHAKIVAISQIRKLTTKRHTHPRPLLHTV